MSTCYGAFDPGYPDQLELPAAAEKTFRQGPGGWKKEFYPLEQLGSGCRGQKFQLRTCATQAKLTTPSLDGSSDAAGPVFRCPEALAVTR